MANVDEPQNTGLKTTKVQAFGGFESLSLRHYSSALSVRPVSGWRPAARPGPRVPISWLEVGASGAAVGRPIFW